MFLPRREPRCARKLAPSTLRRESGTLTGSLARTRCISTCVKRRDCRREEESRGMLSTLLSPSYLDPLPVLATSRTPSRLTYGAAVGKLARAIGKPLMPWQQYVADVALEVDDDGRFVYNLVLVTVPRQSGKTTLFGSVLDHRALSTERARCYFTMQTQKDAVDWLTNERWPLLGPFGSSVSLRRMAGSEHIRWERSGGLVRPFPPNPTGLHGKISDLVVIDEAWSFD